MTASEAAERPFDPYHPDCPSRKLLGRIADKWSVLIIGALAGKPLRYGELSAHVGGISPKMLAQTLKSLERDGLVARLAYAEVPPRVIYRLTEAGAALHPVLRSLEHWVRTHAGEVLTAQAEYDTQAARQARTGTVE